MKGLTYPIGGVFASPLFKRGFRRLPEAAPNRSVRIICCGNMVG